MTRAWILLPLLTLFACGCDDAPATDLDRAVGLARSAALESGHDLEGYALIGARQHVLEGNYVWRVTFKPKHLLPADPAKGMIGAGGEIFVNVVLVTGETTIGFGE